MMTTTKHGVLGLVVVVVVVVVVTNTFGSASVVGYVKVS
jgi:hypothetical protein